jgi:uncharacterized protein YjbI with pentapeptide repeats
MQSAPNRRGHVAQIAAVMFAIVAFSSAAQADIFQWEYINPADPSQGKRQSTTLAPDGAGVDAAPGANLARRNLIMAYLSFCDLIMADLNGADLTNADFLGTTLTDVDFAGAEVRGANFLGATAVGFTAAQLYSTASYRARDLTDIRLIYNNFAGANFIGQNLTKADFSYATLSGTDFREANLTNVSFGVATLTDADFTGAEIRGAIFGIDPQVGGTGITLAQLYSTASYQAHDLSGVNVVYNNLGGGNFAGQNLSSATFQFATLSGADFREANLTTASFLGATLTGADFTDANLTNAYLVATVTDADFTGAEVRGAVFSKITLAQLYSTASYQAHNLGGIRFASNDFSGGNFARQDLKSADFGAATLNGTNFREANIANANFVSCIFGCQYASLTDADVTAADARGASGFNPFSSNVTMANLIWSNGSIDGLDLDAGRQLVVRDHDGNRKDFYGNPTTPVPIPITVYQHLAMGPRGTLRMVFEADAWDSTISFAPDIPVMLGGTLELMFADDVNLSNQVGRTFDLFDWTGVTPTGAFGVASPYTWDLSHLYTTGEITLSAIPEPASLALAAAGVVGVTLYHRRKRP